MNHIKFSTIFLLLILSAKLVSSQNLEPEIDKIFHVNKNEPGFSVAVFKGNDIVFEKTYGSANLDYDIPITSETVFDIASISILESKIIPKIFLLTSGKRE